MPSAAIPIGRWHQVEVHLRLNQIIAGTAAADGRLSYRIDGREILSRADLVFRTAAHPDLRFNQVMVGPYAHQSPREQSMWIDDLVIALDEEPSLTPTIIPK